MEATSPKWKCWQGHALFRASRGGSFLGSCSILLLKCYLACRVYLHLCLHGHLVCSLSMSLSFSYKNTGHIGLRGRPTVVWPHLNFITSTMTVFPNKVILRYQQLKLKIFNLISNTIQPKTSTIKCVVIIIIEFVL